LPIDKQADRDRDRRFKRRCFAKERGGRATQVEKPIALNAMIGIYLSIAELKNPNGYFVDSLDSPKYESNDFDGMF